MPGMYLTMFESLELELPALLVEELPTTLCEALSRALPENLSNIDLRWLNPIRGDRCRNATSSHLVVEFSSRDLPADDETLVRAARALLDIFKANLPPTMTVGGNSKPTDYDVWIKTFRDSNALFGVGIVGKDYWLATGKTIPVIEEEKRYLSRTTGEVVRAWREAQNMTGYRLTKDAVLPSGYLSKLEAGTITWPSEDILRKIANVLHVSIITLVTRKLPADFSSSDESSNN